MWLDDIHLQNDVTNLYRRDFQNGIVLVNPAAQVMTAPLEREYRKILGTRDPVINDRFNRHDDEELTALLACGSGLGTVPVRDLAAAATAMSPEYPLAATEFAEVAWRASPLRGRIEIPGQDRP